MCVCTLNGAWWGCQFPRPGDQPDFRAPDGRRTKEAEHHGHALGAFLFLERGQEGRLILTGEVKRDDDTGRLSMPKMKTHKGAAKRFKLTKKGKVKHRRKNRSHILTKKSPKRKRQLRKDGYLEGADAANMKRLLAKG